MAAGKYIVFPKDCKGVTLVELVVVLAIIVIVAALAAVSSGFVGTDRVKSASKELLADLQLIRQSAMTQGPDDAAPHLRGFGIAFESKNRYRLFRFNDGNANFIYNGTGEEISLTAGEAAPRQRDITTPLELKIKSSGNLIDPANDVLIFDQHGIPRDTNLSFKQRSIVIQKAADGDVQKKCVIVTFNRIREGLWDGNSCQEQ
jgi:prepilin-type N-terminal cleavage/methylation domain-containing protein